MERFLRARLRAESCMCSARLSPPPQPYRQVMLLLSSV